MAIIAAAAAAGIPLEVFIAEEVLTNLVFQLVGQVVSAALAPEMLELQQLSFRLVQSRELDPAIAVDAYVKSHLDENQAKDRASAAGYSGEVFKIMADTAGEPPGVDFLAEAWRRGIIDFDDTGPGAVTFKQGVLESRVKNKWWEAINRMAFRLPDPGTVTEARLRGYINPAKFQDLMRQIGFDAEAAHFIYVAAGVPLSPGEGYEAFHRGLIPEDDANPDNPSLAQIFRESRINDKYLAVWKALNTYLPPPRTVTALLRVGSITQAQALDLFKKSGLTPELAAAYVADASNQRLQGTKELAKGDVLNLYAAKEMSAKDAHDALAAMGYSDADIGFELGYTDFKLVTAQVSAGVSRLRTLYTGHKINKQTAVDTLATLGLQADAVNAMVKVWDAEAEANPTLLTAVQIADIAAQGYLAPADALNELQGRGYDERDAYALLVLHKVDVSALQIPAGLQAPPK